VAEEEFAGLRTLGGQPVAPESLRGEGVALLCGLARPQAFEIVSYAREAEAPRTFQDWQLKPA
jgi:hypothetical protein